MQVSFLLRRLRRQDEGERRGHPNTVQIRKIDAHIAELDSLVLSLQLFLFEPYWGAPRTPPRGLAGPLEPLLNSYEFIRIYQESS